MKHAARRTAPGEYVYRGYTLSLTEDRRGWLVGPYGTGEYADRTSTKRDAMELVDYYHEQHAQGYIV